jgi:hypothetical protein
MPKPTSKVVLSCDALNRTDELEFDHAQNLLRLQEKKKFKARGFSVWELPENSKFYFKDGDLRKRTNKAPDKDQAEA